MTIPAVATAHDGRIVTDRCPSSAPHRPGTYQTAAEPTDRAVRRGTASDGPAHKRLGAVGADVDEARAGRNEGAVDADLDRGVVRVALRYCAGRTPTRIPPVRRRTTSRSRYPPCRPDPNRIPLDSTGPHSQTYRTSCCHRRGHRKPRRSRPRRSVGEPAVDPLLDRGQKSRDAGVGRRGVVPSPGRTQFVLRFALRLDLHPTAVPETGRGAPVP